MREWSSYNRINAHGHLLPYPEDIPRFMRDKKYFWVDADRKFMCQNDWKRPITDKSFFLNEKIEWLAENNIDHEVLITLSQLYCNGLGEDTCGDIIRFQNDFHARVQAEHLEVFTGGFVVQPAHIDQALKEIDRCVHELGLEVMCLPTHFLMDDTWVSIACPETMPLFALADELGLAIEVHPYDAPKMIKLRDEYWRFHLIWMCAQTADAFHMFTSRGFHRMYPNARVCFAHGNQYGQINIGRRKQGYYGRPDLFKDATDPEDSLGVNNLFFDTLVHDVLSFRLMVERSGVDQIVFGLDDPYPLGELDIGHDCYPGQVLDEAVESGFITVEDRSLIVKNNVVRWIDG